MGKFVRDLTKDVKIHNESKVYDGYTLFAPCFANFVWLIDMDGNICHYWEMEHIPGLHGKILPTGNLMFLGRGPGAFEELGGCASELIEVDWEGNEVWRYDDTRLNHDFVCLENGNIVVLRFEDIPDDIQKKIKGGLPGTELNGKRLGVQVAEITRDKKTMWEWNNWEHFDVERDIECPLAFRMVYGYTNSVDVFPNGDVILSVRHMNKVIRVSKKTGDIIWEWGHEDLLGHQHDVSVLENGNILIFDNGLHRIPKKPEHSKEMSFLESSRAVEVNPDTNEIVWEYKDPTNLIYTHIAGGAQRLLNRNTLICESRTGILYEVTYDKEVVWKYESPFMCQRPNIWGWSETKLIFQAHRYGRDYKGLKNKDLDPEKYEWIIRRKGGETIKMEERIKSRLAKAGY
jgi:hypothetical protein